MRRISILILSLFGLYSLAHAQIKPKRNAEVLVTFDVCAPDVTYQPSFPSQTDGTLLIRVFDSATGALAFSNTWNGLSGAAGQITHSGAQHMKLVPNRLYQATITLWNASISWGELKISAPPGYAAVFDGVVRESFHSDPAQLVNNHFSFALRETGDGGTLPAGMAMAPDVGDFAWTLSTGTYANGLSVNPVQLRGPSLSTAMLSPTALNFVNPYSPEVNVVTHSDGGPLEIETYQAILYFRRGTPSGGYTIEVYSPYAVRTGSGDGPYSYNETPYREFRFGVPGGGSWNNSLQIEKVEREGSTTVSETWTVTQNGANWTVVESNSLRTITRVSSGTSPRVETVEVRDNANALATKLRRTYQTQPWGQEEMTEEVANPDSTNGPALTTTYAYHTTGGTGGYGRLKSVLNPDGSWIRFDYDSSNAGLGNLTGIFRPWQDSVGTSVDTATVANSHATIFSYVAQRSIFLDLPSGVETKILDKTAAKTTASYAYPGNAPNGQPLREQTIRTYTGSGANDYLTTVRTIYDPHTAADIFRGRLYRQTEPDGRKVSTLRYQGYWWNYDDSNSTDLHKWPGNPQMDNTWGEYRFNGFSTQVSGSQLVNLWDGQGIDAVYMVPNRSSIDLDIHDDQGRVAWRANYVFSGASGGIPTFEFLSLQQTGYDNGIPVMGNSLNGAKEQAWLTNGRITSSMANEGTVTGYGYDALGRPVLQSREAFASSGEYAAQDAIYHHRVFDAADRVTSETVTPSSTNTPSDLAVTTTRVFNPAGLLRSDTAESGAGNFLTAYDYANGGSTVTANLPGGATKVVTRWLDGSLKSVTGTADVNTHRQVTVNADGTLTTAQYTLRTADLAAPTAAPRWTKVTTDWAGRVQKEERPAPLGANPSVFTKQYYYNSFGQLFKVKETDLAPILIKYNAWQQPYRAGLDLNANDDLDVIGLDRINETDKVFEKDGNGAWWAKSTDMSYQAETNGTPVTTSVTKVRLNKYSDHGRLIAGNYVQSEMQITDIFGNVTKRTVAVQRGSSYFANDFRLATETTDYGDSSIDEVVTSRNGRHQKRQTKENLVYKTSYDARGRALKTTDPRIDTSTTARIGYVAKSDRLAWHDDTAGNRTIYGYDSNSGRLISETLPVPAQGLTAPVSYFGYNKRGQTIRTWGNGAIPVETAFNEYGESIAQRTFRDGTSWANSDWPLSDSGIDTNGNPAHTGWTSGDKTLWAYDPASGTLTSKTDAASKAVTYTYNSRAQIKTRFDARSLTTTYDYDGLTAENLFVTYPSGSGTANLAVLYNRQGLPKQVTDAAGTRLLDYCSCGKLSHETLDSGFYGGRSIEYKLEQSLAGALGRTKGYTLLNGAAVEQELTYGFETTTGRLNSVIASPTGFGATTFTYGYTPESDLLASITELVSGWTQTRTYLSNRNLLDVIETKMSTLSKAKFDYGHDALGRRTSVAKTGEMFSRYSASGLDTFWGYNARNEVESEQTYLRGAGTVLQGRNDSYVYDPIGNRTATVHNSVGAVYTPNALNQYSQRVVPGSLDVTGLAPAGATITINSSTANVDRQGQYYRKSQAADNSTAGIWQNVVVSSSAGGSESRNSYVALTPESFTHDNNGNLVRDGRWVYQHDAENRPILIVTRGAPEDPLAIEVENIAVWTSGVSRQKIEFKYDYKGRRVRKTVYNRNAGNTAWDLGSDVKFIYEGWNLIAEYNVGSGGALTLARSHAWGLDWSGTRQGAGGVGGLLQSAIHSGGNTRYLPAFDGNGNVMAMINQSTGALAAVYEYDAFGQILRAEGTYADANPFRFSTKFHDSETGLIYYGLRYYSPSMGRFINKDPIEEQGGINLYAFVRNNGVNNFDVLGMWPLSTRPYLSNGFDAVPVEIPTGPHSSRTIWIEVGQSDFDKANAIASLNRNNGTANGGGTNLGGEGGGGAAPGDSGSDSDGFDGQDANGQGGTAMPLPPVVVTATQSPTVSIPTVATGTIVSQGSGGAPNNAENPDCAGLRARMATATAIYEKHRSFFQAGGQYGGFADTVGIYDNLSMAGMFAGAATSTYAAYAGSLPTQTVQQLPMGAETFRNVAGEARIAGRVAGAVGVLGIVTDTAYFGNALANGDGAGALLSGGNAAYGIAGMALGGPIGLVGFGGAQVLVNSSLYVYQRHQDSTDRRNTLQSAQASQDAMATAQRVGADIAAQMQEKGCK